jgi:hypothetical protein
MLKCNGMQAFQAVPKHTLQAILQKQATIWKEKGIKDTADKVLNLPRAFINEWLCFHPERLDLRGSQLPASKILTLIAALQAHHSLRVLHIPCSSPAVYFSDESLCVLLALKAAVSSWRSLSVLGLHGLHLRNQHLGVLRDILYYLRGSLTGLALSLRERQWQDGEGQVSTQCKLRLFEYVSKLPQLRLLAMPQWQQFVSNNQMVFTPLRNARELTVLVECCDKVASQAYAIVPGLRFRQVMKGIFK